MDQYEQMFADGLRQAVARRPAIRPIEPSEVIARETRSGDDEPAQAPGTSTMSPAAPPRRNSALRWAIGLAAAAAAAAIVLVGPGMLGSRPVEAVPARTPTPAPSPVPVGTPSSEPATRWASPVSLLPDDMPLAPYWAAVRKAREYEGSLVSTAEKQAWWDLRQGFLVSCVAKRGFEFFPEEISWDPPEEGSEAAAGEVFRDRDQLRVPTLDDDRTVVAAVGYGLRSADEVSSTQGDSRIDDSKNAEYAASLSAAEREKYETALGDCRRQVEDEHPDPIDRHWDDLIGNRFDVVMELTLFRTSAGSGTAIEADPRIVELNTEWRTCVTAAGMPIEEARARTKEPGVLDGPLGAFLLAYRTGADGVVAEVDDLDPARVDQRSLVGSEPEIRIALADFDCRAATDYADRIVEVQREREQEFLDAHRRELDKLVAYVDMRVR